MERAMESPAKVLPRDGQPDHESGLFSTFSPQLGTIEFCRFHRQPLATGVISNTTPTPFAPPIGAVP